MSVLLWRLFLFLCCLLVKSEASMHSNETWVRPERVDTCPGNISAESCLTLSELVLANTTNFGNSITIHFLPGVHKSNTSGWIDFGSQVRNVFITGDDYHVCNESSECLVNIECICAKIGFAFTSVDSVGIANIRMSHCGFLIFSNLAEFVSLSKSYSDDCRLLNSSQPKASIFMANVTKIILSNVTIAYGSGYGLLVIGTLSDQFTNHNKITIQDSTFTHNNLNRSIGGSVAIIKPREKSPIICIANITITNVQISHSRGLRCREGFDSYSHLGGGLTIFTMNHVFGYINISNSSFVENTAGDGGGVYISLLYTPLLQFEPLKISVLNCRFTHNEALRGGGLYVAFLHQPEVYSTQFLSESYRYFKMENTTFVSNWAILGGGVYIYPKFIREQTSGYSVELGIKYIICQHCIFHLNQAQLGAALCIKSHSELNLQAKIKVTLILSDTRVTFNQGGALHMYILEENHKSYLSYNILVQYCLVQNNSGTEGVALYVEGESSRRPLITIIDTIFADNRAKGGHIEQETASTVYIERYNLHLSNCTITNNMIRGLYAIISNIVVEGVVHITNNTAIGKAAYGGGIYLNDTLRASTDPWSRILVDINSALYLTGNRATGYGGAIAVSFNGNPQKSCFFGHYCFSFGGYCSNLFTEVHNIMPAVIMKDNTADIAGSDLFGAALETCSIGQSTIGKRELFHAFFLITPKNNSLSSIASVPYKVCICPQNLSHSIETCATEHTLSVFPGRLFHIPLIGVGHWNYPAHSVVQASIWSHSGSALIEDEYITQGVGLTCRNVPYHIYSPLEDNVANMRLVIVTSDRQDFFLPTLVTAHIEVHILNCPFGFVFNNVSCQCSDYHKRAGLECNIETLTIRKHTQNWIGNYSGEIVVHNHCPFAYCNESHLDVDPYNQQEQCDFNRSGVLCGGCRPGHSLALGTSQCRDDCSNIYLLLLIPFALAGVVLVVLLLKCNLTVSTGTINGLVMYANIVHANQSIFFPPRSQSVALYIISILIAWLNLDFGIEVCFTESLNAYVRTWLEFVFPVYIWLMVGVLILVSRYSITVSRLTGSNTVSVLSTLFLLSYTKILRTTFSAFYPAILVTSNGTEHVVWLVDGNFEFRSWPHSLLFVVALLFLTLFILPFTAILLLSPMIQRYSHKRGVRWAAMKIMPLLDAFHGPYKTKYRNWTGLMLLLRLILFVAFASNIIGDKLVNLVVVGVTLTLLLFVWIKVGQVYKKAWINALDLFFLANVLILTVLALYFKSTSNAFANSTLVLIMVGSALLVTCCVLAYHFIQRLRKLSRVKTLIRKVKSSQLFNRDNTPHEDNADDCIQERRPPCGVTTTVVELRESLLTESDSKES